MKRSGKWLLSLALALCLLLSMVCTAFASSETIVESGKCGYNLPDIHM